MYRGKCQRSNRSHGAGFSGRGKTHEYGPKHQEYQCE